MTTYNVAALLSSFSMTPTHLERSYRTQSRFMRIVTTGTWLAFLVALVVTFYRLRLALQTTDWSNYWDAVRTTGELETAAYGVTVVLCRSLPIWHNIQRGVLALREAAIAGDEQWALLADLQPAALASSEVPAGSTRIGLLPPPSDGRDRARKSAIFLALFLGGGMVLLGCVLFLLPPTEPATILLGALLTI